MEKQRASKHRWHRQFWENVDGTDSLWSTNCPTEDRLTFELQIEGRVRSAIPDDLNRLRAAHRRCNWTDRPENALCDLHDALIEVLQNAESLDARDVLKRLHPWWLCVSPTGKRTPAPLVVLPFPEQDLEDFVRELKHQAFITVWRFRGKHHRFLRSLPRHVEAELHSELLEVALREVLDAVRSTLEPDGCTTDQGAQPCQ